MAYQKPYNPDELPRFVHPASKARFAASSYPAIAS